MTVNLNERVGEGLRPCHICERAVRVYNCLPPSKVFTHSLTK